MVAKTFMGLEKVLAEELTALGAQDVQEGNRMVSFRGDKETMYKANFCCRTALRILKPIHTLTASNADELYDALRTFDWSQIMSANSTFCIDSTVYSEEFRHSKYVTYRMKDAIVDFFTEKCGKRPNVVTHNADLMFDVHIAGREVTISLDSSGEPLYKRGWRVGQTDAPINEVLAAGIILLSGWKGESNFVDPMCGSGTFLIEAAMIANNIYPGVYRKGFAFERWSDFDTDIFDTICSDDSQERDFQHHIYGSDISADAIAIASRNIAGASVGKYITLERRDINDITEAPEKGVLVTNPPYGERIRVADMEGLYETLGSKLKNVYKGYSAWVISSSFDLFKAIHLKASVRYPLMNGSLECELRQFEMFDGSYDDLRREGGSIKNEDFKRSERSKGTLYEKKDDRPRDRRDFRDNREPRENRERGERGEYRERREPRDRKFGDRRENREPRSERRPYPHRNNIGHDGKVHSREFSDSVVRFRQPILGNDNEQKTERRQRIGWRRNDTNPDTNPKPQNPSPENEE